jgi:hypothetical protein
MHKQSEKQENKQKDEPIAFITDEQIEEIRRRAVEKAKSVRHTWRQKGGWIICKSCENPHGFRISGEERLTGIDKEGNPIITKHENSKK